MVNAGELSSRIQLQSSSSTVNEYGEAADIVWTTYATRWAKVETNGSAELVEAQQVKSQSTHTFTIRYLSTVVSADRIYFDNRYFNIDGVTNVNEDGRWTVITTKERK